MPFGKTPHHPGGASGLAPLETCLYQFMAPSGSINGDWKPYTGLGMTGMIKGAGYEVYEAALRKRGYGDADFAHDTSNAGYPSWHPVGEACLDFASMFNKIWLGYAPPAEVIREIKRRSTVGTKVYLQFFNYESINQTAEGNTDMDLVRQVSKGHLLRASGVNVNTDMSYVDQFELLDSPAPPPAARYMGSHSDVIPPANNVTGTPATALSHCWYARNDSAGYADDWSSALFEFVETRYGSTGACVIDGVVIDNVLDQANFGSATNEQLASPAYSGASYIAGYQAMLDLVAQNFEDWFTMHGEQLHIVCNGGYSAAGVSTSVYNWDQIPGRFGEFYFHLDANPGTGSAKLWTTIETDLKAIAAQLRATPYPRGRERVFLVWATKTLLANFFTPASWAEVDRWALDPDGPKQRSNGWGGTWAQFRELVNQLRIVDRVHIMNGRGSSKFYLFWNKYLQSPEGLAKPRRII